MSDDHPPPRQVTAGAPAPTATQVPWNRVTGLQLEELLHGLLDAMGASGLTWRAGSAAGVTATDGGRDLEAIFDRPSPDGELDRQRWWVESKGRTGTVERGAVQQAVLDASGRSDVDILVIATNSRFSNPTRDWVSEHSRSHPRPLVKLWDRDNLDRLVRKYPTVMARVLPNALPDEERLNLLVTRFEELGEEPTQLDLEFFWERQNWLMEQEPKLLAGAIAMFLYAEGILFPRQRDWWRLLQSADAPDALIKALIRLPSLLDPPLPRPLDMIRVLASAGRMLIACLLLLPSDIGIEMSLNPWRYVIDGEDVADDEQQLRSWQEGALHPVLVFIQSDLLDACSSDCNRVTGDNPHEPDSISTTKLWHMLYGGNSTQEEGVIVIESVHGRCTVGLDVTNGCPLVVSNELSTEEILRGVYAVLQFRRDHPENASEKGESDVRGARITVLSNHGLAYRTARVSG